MIARCTDPEHPDFKDYGGRGINVCDRWRKSFDDFIEDLGPVVEGLTIGRIDNDGDYEPSNVRLETWAQQHANMRSNRLLSLDGVTRNTRDWSTLLGINYQSLHSRLRSGWSAFRALTEPVRKRKSA